MMDVSMYGNHHTSHPTGYQPTEIGSSGYSYFSSHHHHLNQIESSYHPSPTSNTTSTISTSSSSSTSHLYHPHLYSPSAAEYGITTTGHNIPPDDSYYDNSTTSVHNFYNTQHHTSHPTNVIQDHIISSDNGLSYTNLDYMYGQSHHGNNVYLNSDDKISLTHSYNITSDDILGPVGHSHHLPSATSTGTWHQHHHTNSSYLDTTLSHQIGINSVSNSITGQNQMRQLTSPSGRSISHGSPGAQQQQQHLQQQQQQQQPQSHQPTYKWMQVKRNVPKPQSKLLFNRCLTQ